MSRTCSSSSLTVVRDAPSSPPSKRRGAAGEHDRSGGGGHDRAGRLVDAVFLQQVPGGSCGQHLRHTERIAQARPSHDGRQRRGVAEPPDEVDVLQAFQAQLGGDDVRLDAGGHLDHPVGFRGDLDLHGRVEHAQRMLQPGHLVGGVAQENLHAVGIGVQEGGLRVGRARPVQCTMPVRMAMATACARSFAPSFSKMRSRWVLTVWGEMPRSLATCLVVAPSATRLEDLALAFGQRRRVGGRVAHANLLDERPRELGVDDRVALDRVARRVDQGVGRGILQEVAGDPGLDRLGDGSSRFVDGDQDDLGPGCGLQDLAGGLDAVHARHPHVHEDDVGSELAGAIHRLLAARGLSDDEDVVRQPEGRAQAFSRHGMVIDDHRADLCPCGRSVLSRWAK